MKHRYTLQLLNIIFGFLGHIVFTGTDLVFSSPFMILIALMILIINYGDENYKK